jgi:regulator of RNase E activity RraB
MNWPHDADGDVFRRLELEGFDFTIKHAIDFHIDFDYWPLDKKVIEIIKADYPGAKIMDLDEEDIEEGNTIGYVQFQVVDKLTYDLVMSVQESVTKKFYDYGGWCESWGVMHKNYC